LRVLRSGGLVSDGALVMLRGPTSLIGASVPIVIIDGVRVDSRQFDEPLDLGAVAPSRLDDLLPEDIERIEVLSGAAAALYGDGAANGVILVMTKSGGPGPLRLSGRVTYSATQNNTEFPANYERVGTSPSTGQPAANCSLAAVAAGTCAPTALHVWNPLMQASPFRTGNSALGRVALGGTALGTSLFAGLTANGRQGTLPRDAIDRIGVRGKLARALPGHLSVEASGGSLHEHGRFAVDGDLTVASNVVGNGLIGLARDDANHGYAVGLFPGDSMLPSNHLRHNTGGITVRWQPGTWLGATVMTGRDLVTERWHEDHLGQGSTASAFDRRIVEQYDTRTSGATISSSYPIGAVIDASTRIGIDRDVLQTASFDSSGSPPGLFAAGSSQLSLRSTAFWVSEGLDLPRQIHANISAERAASAILGPHGRKEWFPSANIAWSPPLASHGLSHVRVRAAYAEAPGASTSLLSLLTIVLPPFSSPPPPPRMERTKDLELGAEANVGRLTRVNLSAFSDRSTKLWANNVPTPLGLAIAQDGTMTNTGIEGIVQTTLLELPSIRWDGTLSVAILHNRVTGFRAPPGLGTTNPVSPGYAFGGLWTQDYTYADANHDGIIAASEVRLGATRYAGPALPTLESAFATDLSLPGHLVVSALLDYRQGNRALDLTSRIRCDFQICRESQDPTASLDRQAAAVASQLSGLYATGFSGDASFMRVREIAVRWRIPPAGARFFGVDADLTLAGRNLATWTTYRGLDPEVSYQPPDILPRQEFLTMPLPREFIVRLDIRP
jgi:TonB-dependent SusC/RagA subfamily outer membrane receptor